MTENEHPTDPDRLKDHLDQAGNLPVTGVTILSLQVTVQGHKVKLARRGTPRTALGSSHPQVPINRVTVNRQVHRQVTDQAPILRGTANHQVTGSNRSQITVDRHQCIQKPALTASEQLGKTKTSVHTATKRHKPHHQFNLTLLSNSWGVLMTFCFCFLFFSAKYV